MDNATATKIPSFRSVCNFAGSINGEAKAIIREQGAIGLGREGGQSLVRKGKGWYLIEWYGKSVVGLGQEPGHSYLDIAQWASLDCGLVKKTVNKKTVIKKQ